MKLARLASVAGINRPALYTLLPAMVRKGLVTESVKGKQKVYVPEHPEKLERMLRETREQLEASLPDLTQLYEGLAKRPVVRYVSGREGVQSVFLDLVETLRTGDTFYRYSAPAQNGARADEYLPKEYRVIRDAKKLERLVITGKQVATQKKPRLERHIKILSEIDERDFSVTTLIYGNKMAVIDYEAESAVIIESAGIARFQKALFRELYKRL
jgi:sugar-specific transcriptional regulator TrmB